MRILADENMSKLVIDELRRGGHDVLSAKESMPAEPDEAVLERAGRESRVVITHDKDFGELAFRTGLPTGCGVILFRLPKEDPQSDCRRMVQTIEAREDWTGLFVAVTDKRVRIHPLLGR
jgi:predicted nuclease of predicted toxin-antitoxin system